jgi:site-specific recombinase XerD
MQSGAKAPEIDKRGENKMSELTVDVLISNVLNGMVQILDNGQMKKLKEQLYIELHDVDITNKHYELAETINENDMMKLNYFAASLRVSKYSEGTIKQYIRSAKLLRDFVGKNYCDIVCADVKYFLAYYQKHNNWSDATIRNNIRNLSAFFKFLTDEEMIQKNPMAKINNIHAEKVIKEGFSSEDMERLRVACRDNARDAALIEFLYASGVRVDELIKLCWKDIDVKNRSLIVKGKGSKERKVLFTERAAFCLDKYFNDRMEKEKRSKEEMMQRPLFVTARRSHTTHDFDAITDDGVRVALNSIGKIAGVSKVHPHRFRRTFATNAINHGMPLEQLMVLMGHNQYDTTLIYAKVKTSRVEQSYRMYCE